MTDRERFEEWALSQEMRIERFAERHPNEDWSRSCFGPDDYEWNTTRGAWVVWQAALAAERKRLKGVLSAQRDRIDSMGWSVGVSQHVGGINWAIQQIEAKQ